jgi:hypothetical protein
MVGWSMGVERLASQASGQIGLSGVRTDGEWTDRLERTASQRVQPTLDLAGGAGQMF